MNRIILILFLFLSKSLFCQKTFVIDNFSEDYFGKLFIADKNEVFSKGWVAIFDKKSKKQLIKVNSDELTYSLHKGKVVANVKELPYGEQSSILYEDFNFDGIKDFAIMDGQNSCYHGPSFEIYLGTSKGFIYSPEFTELAQNYCGMFETDHKTKTIHTMTKSGCCWHQYSDFKVKNNNPYPIKIVEEGVSPTGITWDYEEQNLVNGKMVKSTYQILAVDMIKENLLLSFKFENKKKMKIFKDGSLLYYVFTDSKDKIELLYRSEFTYSKRDNKLAFTYRNTEYIISDNKIIVKTPNNSYDMKAVNNSQMGTLKKIMNLKIENVTQ